MLIILFIELYVIYVFLLPIFFSFFFLKNSRKFNRLFRPHISLDWFFWFYLWISIINSSMIFITSWNIWFIWIWKFYFFWFNLLFYLRFLKNLILLPLYLLFYFRFSQNLIFLPLYLWFFLIFRLLFFLSSLRIINNICILLFRLFFSFYFLMIINVLIIIFFSFYFLMIINVLIIIFRGFRFFNYTLTCWEMNKIFFICNSFIAFLTWFCSWFTNSQMGRKI